MFHIHSLIFFPLSTHLIVCLSHFAFAGSSTCVPQNTNSIKISEMSDVPFDCDSITQNICFKHKSHRYYRYKYRIFTYLLTGRGGQSALRFARLRMEKRHNYVRKVAEVAVQLFITNDKPNIAGLVLAGSADFKTELSQSDMFDPVGLYCFMKCFKYIFNNLFGEVF